MKLTKISLLLLAFAALPGFTRGAYTTGTPAAPILTGSTVYGSSPAVTSAAMHQAGSASTATIANSGGTPTSCSVTAGDPSGNFQCAVVAGAVQVQYTSTGATNLNGSSALVTQTLTVTASNGGGTSSGVSVPVNVYNDGALQAPIGGSVPNPTLFSGYTHGRPPWLVPGTDYPVGIPAASLPLKVPGVNSLPAGATLSGTVITMTGSGVDLNGWDLSGSGGIQVQLSGCTGCTVENNKIVMGATNKVPVFMSNSGTSSNLTLRNNEISQGGQNDGTFGGMVYWVAGGGTTAEYNYMHDAGDDFFDFVATGTDLIHHNLLMDNAQVAGGHPDFMQTNGGTSYTYQTSFNSWVNVNPPSTVAGQGLVFGDNGFNVTGTNFFDWNVTIAKGAGLSMSGWVRVFAPNIPAGVSVSVSNNYVDLSEAGSFNHDAPSDPCASGCSGGGTDTWAGNINLTTGATFTFTQ